MADYIGPTLGSHVNSTAPMMVLGLAQQIILKQLPMK
jgi:hypothetical protein